MGDRLAGKVTHRDRRGLGDRAGERRSGSPRRARASPASTSTGDAVEETARRSAPRRSPSSPTSRMPAEVQAYTDETVERWGGLHVVFNNAGVNLPGVFHEATDEVIDRTLDVNVKGRIYGCRYAIPHMLRGGGGSLINTTSVNGLVAEPFLAIYATSKGAIVMLVKGIALDYAKQGIRCNAIAPGWVDTPINYAHAEMLGGLGGGLCDHRFVPADRPARRAAGDRQRGALPRVGRIVVRDRLGASSPTAG